LPKENNVAFPCGNASSISNAVRNRTLHSRGQAGLPKKNSGSMISDLQKLFLEVRHYLMEGNFDRHKIVGRNEKGDITKTFDLGVEKVIENYIKRNFDFAVELLTEEQGRLRVGKAKPKYTFVIDPVDGSNNFSRMIENTGFSIAVLPYGKKLSTENVKYAFIGSVWSGTMFWAERGKGAFRNGKKIRTSKTEKLEDALVSIDMGKPPESYLALNGPILEDCREMRMIGSSSIEHCMVACGAFDAHLDLRDICTPENWFAGQMIVNEAGGIITDVNGKQIREIKSLCEPRAFVVCANKKLHREIIEKLKEAE
jgi:myo-inositol-1(or 4)-monophosphatase